MPVGQSVSRQPVARAGGWIPCGHAKHTIHGDVPVRRGREGSGSRRKLKFEISILCAQAIDMVVPDRVETTPTIWGGREGTFRMLQIINARSREAGGQYSVYTLTI